jgi:RNA polymerase sigma factor (sigma-70 family)
MQNEQTGLHEDFGKLHRQFAPRLRGVVLRRLWRGESSVDSVMQTVLWSFAGRLRQAKPASLEEEDLWRLLFQIALRHCDKHNHRTNRRRKSGKIPDQFSQLEPEDAEHAAPFDVPDHTSDLQEVELQDFVEHFLDRLKRTGLDEQEISVFRLRLAGYSKEEIATKTGFPVGRVNTLLRHIRATLRNNLNEVGV